MKGYNYFEFYLTFRCPLKCSYCINSYNGIDRSCKEMSGKDIVSVLNKIDFEGTPLTFGGGEPTYHKDFYYIVNELNSNIKIDLLTNLTFNIDKFIDNIIPQRFNSSQSIGYKNIRVSYHPEQMDKYKLIDKAVKLQNKGFNIGIFGINHPDHTVDNIQMAELARINQIYFFIKDYLGYYNETLLGFYKYPQALDKNNKLCECITNEVLVSPEGYIYKCHTDLYSKERSIGHIIDGIPNKEYRICNLYGNCNPCDVKMKTNRFMQQGQSSVNIKEV